MAPGRLAELERGALRGERRALLERMGLTVTSPRPAPPARRGRPAGGPDRRRSRAAVEARQAQVDAWSAERFAEGFAELRLFGQHEGHVRVLARYETPSGYRLGQWCWWLRGHRRAGRLSSERVAALDEIGFCWDPRGDLFARALAEWRAANGDEPVRTLSGFGLRAWCERMRGQHAAGVLAPERVSALEAAGFSWRRVLEADVSWATGIAALDAHLAAGSGRWVPVQFTTPDGFHLGAWLNRQRGAWRAGRLDAAHAADLRRRGVSPSFDNDRLVWGIAALRRFRERHPGRVPSQVHVDPDGFALGYWLVVRRREARAGILDRRVELLFAELEIDPFAHPRPMHATHEAAWEVALEAYRAWMARRPGRFPPRGTRLPDGRDLAVWVQNQRTDLRLGRTTPDRRVALEAAGLGAAVARVSPSISAFTAALAAFQAFTTAHGHDRVPTDLDLPDGRPLAEVVRRWRRSIAQGSMSAERAALVMAAGLVVAPGGRSVVGRPLRVSPARSGPDHLGRRLREWRAAEGVSAEDAAVAIGVSKASLAVLEQHRRRTPPRIAVVGRIAEIIGIDRRQAALLAGWDPAEVEAIYGRAERAGAA